ncbi:MAG: hypothetical protein ACTS27_07835 [Phycisphaerales bacterium]
MTSFPSDKHPDGAPRLAGEYDALADLFLGGAEPKPLSKSPPLRLVSDDRADAAASTPQHTPRELHVEAMLLGSLPVYASAWITQFVRVEAARLGAPVALVRSLSGEGSVDLVGEHIDSACANESSSLRDALTAAAGAASRVIVRTGETSEADLAAHDGVRTVTLLTGVDEPAMIAAYRTLKSLAPRWSAMTNPPAVRVAAMGATGEQGRRAFEKIARAAKVFLETPLAYAGHVERIEPVRSVCLYRGPNAASLTETLDHIRAASRDADRETPEPKPDEGHAVAVDIIDDPAPGETDLSNIESHATPVPCTDAGDDSLASRVRGLVRVPLTVPRCEGVELAADASGGLHLLAIDDSSASPTASLLSAQAWASVNREVLAAACSTILGRAIESGKPATLHLFTQHPKRVRGLLDADLRVHFLGSVEMNGERAWCVAELN